MPKKLPSVNIKPDTPNYVKDYDKLVKMVSKKQYHGATIKTSFVLPKSLHKAFSIKAKQHDKSMGGLFIEWIEQYLRE